MDQWILSRLESLKANIEIEMEAYRLYNVVPALFSFIEDLTNWYIRLNRSRFWSEEKSNDKLAAYQTLYTTIFELSVSMAPFAPFLSETIYQSLLKISAKDSLESVHLCRYPEADKDRIKPLLEKAVTRIQHVILLGRQKRNQEKLKTKIPVARLTIIHRDEELLSEIRRLESYLSAELNVKKLDYSTDEQSFIHLYAKPNSPVLGKRLGADFKDFRLAIERLDSQTIDRFQRNGKLELNGETFNLDDIFIYREAKAGTNAVSDRYISIDMDCAPSEELLREGLARELVNRIQKTRKDYGLNVSDRILILAKAEGKLLEASLGHQKYIMQETLCTEWIQTEDPQANEFIIDGEAVSFTIQRLA